MPFPSSLTRALIPLLPLPLEVGPLLNQLEGGVRDGAVDENKFGALCQKATGDNHFEYSEVHVLYYAERKKTIDYRTQMREVSPLCIRPCLDL